MTSDAPRAMHPYEVEYDSGGNVAFRTFTAYEMINEGGMIRFTDADGVMVFAVSAGHVISINRRDTTRVSTSVAQEVINGINAAVRNMPWLNI